MNETIVFKSIQTGQVINYENLKILISLGCSSNRKNGTHQYILSFHGENRSIILSSELEWSDEDSAFEAGKKDLRKLIKVIREVAFVGE